MSSGFIRFEKKDGAEYAFVCKAKRVDGKKTNDVENLGRVIDRARGIYKNRQRGLFAFSLEGGYAPPPPDLNAVMEEAEEKLILDFGDVFLLDEILKKSGLRPVFEKACPDASDTLLAMLAHRLLDVDSASRYAHEWWEGSYARFLYPKAALHSQRISEFLSMLGEESGQREFFKAYIAHLVRKQRGSGVLIDSTGLPNDIHFPLTAINSHNGVISNESRLIFVIDRHTSMPIYFRYTAGNTVDVATLKATLLELAAYGVKVNYVVVDAGYYSETNIRDMQAAGIPFIVRLVPNRKIYKDLVAEHIDGLEDAKYMVRYGQRLVFIKQAPVSLFGKAGFAYIAVDMDRKHDEIRRYALSALDDGDVPDDKINAEMRTKGMFILLSAQNIGCDEILPVYYEREKIEQVFDFSKNNADLLPLRLHSEEAFRGHLLLSFLASAAYLTCEKMLEGSGMCAMQSFHSFRNLKCKVFDDKIVVQEANKKMNDTLRHLKLKLPSYISLW